jgi:hypothetical protein
MLRHYRQHFGKSYQRDKCRIESLLLCRIGKCRTSQTLVVLQPIINIQNFLGIGRRGCNLREQRIRIKSNRSQQLIQLLVRQWRGLR